LVGRAVTDKRTGRSFIQTDQGLKPMAGFRPQSSMGSLSDQRSRMIQEINLKLVGKSAEEAMAILRPYNQALAGQGLPIIQPTEVGIQAPQIGGGAVAPATPAQGTGGAVAPAATTTTPAGAPAVGATGPVAPGGPRPNITATTPQLNPVVGGAGTGGRPTMTQIEATGAGEKKASEATAEDIAKAKINNNKIIEQANNIGALTNQLLEHEGFKSAVGVGEAFGLPVPGAGAVAGMFPGSDTKSFQVFFDQVKGQSFLVAIESLRGMGALSDAEGKAATAAVSALSMDMSEQDFRKASHQLNTIIRRAADRNAVKAGQKPPFNEKDLNEQAKENKQAERWLKSARPGGKNPDGTPITQEQIDAVRQTLWMRGVIK
jgi:hypothetical protein